MRTSRAIRGVGRRVRAWAARLVAVCGGGALAGCTLGSEPIDNAPPFIVVIPRVTAVPGAVLPPVTYRLRQLSEPGTRTTMVVAGARDTVRFGRLELGTYLIEAIGFPDRCTVQDEGARQTAIVFDNNTTSIVRLSVSCVPALVVNTSVEGEVPRDSVTLLLQAPDGQVTTRRLASMTTRAIFDDVPAGEYRVGFLLLPPNCHSLAPGGARRVPVDVPRVAGTTLTLAYQCAPTASSPRLLTMAASRREGIAGFIVRAVDPNRNLDRLAFSLTDCAGRHLLAGGERIRTGFLRDNGVSDDTSQATVAVPIPASADSLGRICVGARVLDRDGNSSAIVERELLEADPARAPRATEMNAVFTSRFAMSVTLAVADPQGDYAGAFGLLVLRDGTLNGQFDGQPDIASWNGLGFPGTQLPVLPIGNGRPDLEAYVEMVLVLIDRTGQIAVVRDRSLLQ